MLRQLVLKLLGCAYGLCVSCDKVLCAVGAAGAQAMHVRSSGSYVSFVS